MPNQQTRRDALKHLAAFIAASPLLRAQQDPFHPHPRVPGLFELDTSFDFEPVAHDKIIRSAYDYSSYGAGGEFTLRRNREAFDWVEVIAQTPTTNALDTSTALYGQAMNYPIMVAPTAYQGQLHEDAENATHQGAAAASNTTMVLSNNATKSFPEVAAAAGSPMWFQLYPRQDIASNRELLETVQNAGAQAIVVTVDQQASIYERQLHDRNLTAIQRPPGQEVGRRAFNPANPYRLPTNRLWYSWKMFDQLREMIRVPILAKGILTAEDAALCVDHGLDGIYVSNHGGRSLDYESSTLEALPEIADAVGGRIPIIFDSGIRRGSDVLKALALGANAVAVGRVIRWGVAAYGAQGVQRVLEILQAELRQAMAYAGVSSLAAINRDIARVEIP